MRLVGYKRKILECWIVGDPKKLKQYVIVRYRGKGGLRVW